jgi:hypothetical protein
MIRKLFLLTFIVATIFTANAQSEQPSFTSKDLIGHWVSSTSENYGQFFGKREFFLTEKAWAILFSAYGDEAATTPLWTLRVEGTYVLGQAHPGVPGARYADFTGGSKYITAFTDDFLSVFSNGAAWEKGVEYDFSRTGAGFFPSVEAGPVEYDLVLLEGDTLFLGDRSGNLNVDRASKASSYPLVRQ